MSWTCIGCGVAVDVYENPITGAMHPLCYDCAEQQRALLLVRATDDWWEKIKADMAEIVAIAIIIRRQRIRAAKRRARVVTWAKGSKRHD